MLNSRMPTGINTFFGSSKTNVSSLIREMKLDKSDFFSLAKKMSGSNNFGQFNVAQITSFAQLKKEPIVDLFRDTSARIRLLFDAVNSGGTILDSMVSVLSSEITKLEKDISNLELFINNYEFISGKDDLYNGNYIEKFDNILNDYRSDGSNFLLTDRDNVNFESNGNAYVDSSSGVLKIGKEQKTINVIKNIKSITVSNNYSNYITSESEFLNVFTDTLEDSWTITIKSPVILTTELSKYSKYITYSNSSNGAKTAIEVEFETPINIDTLRVLPNLGNDLSLSQVVLFKAPTSFTSSQNTTEQYINLLTTPKLLKNSIELVFEKSNINKIIFIFNQAAYLRSKLPALMSEMNSKAMNKFIQDRLKERRSKFSKIQDMAYWYFKKNRLIDGIKRNKNFDYEYYSCKFPSEFNTYSSMIKDEMFRASAFDIEDNLVFSHSPLFIDLAKSMLSSLNIDTSFIDQGFFVESNSINNKSVALNLPGHLPYRSSSLINDPRKQFFDNNGNGSVQQVVKSLLTEESADSYEYNFSLKSIEFIETISNNYHKACFISKKIPAQGSVIAVKAKLDSSQIISASNQVSYDLKSLSSYELSISNVENPSSESDWIPLGFNNKEYIDSEMIFFDVTDFTARLRFQPKSDSIILYKDGYLVNSSKYYFNDATKKLQLINISEFSENSFYCVSYQIDTFTTSPLEIDLVKSGIFNNSVKQYRNKNGLGQVFQKTNSSGSIVLENIPYINDLFVRDATYDPFFGTIFTTNDTGSYNPVKVLLNDGTYALNLTNYSKSPKSVNFYGSSSVQFIHSGKNITFNTRINSPFTVMYEFVPNSLRFRLIMRKNISNISIPVAADSVLLKMKTNYFDPYFDKLNYVSKV